MSKRKAWKVARTVGIPIGSRHRGIAWDGRDLLIYGRNLSASDLIHEVAHFQVTSRKYLSVPNYGLGSAFDDWYWGPDDTVPNTKRSFEACLREEYRASILGIMWEKHLGLDWRETAMSHNWQLSEDDSTLEPEQNHLPSVMTWLRARCLLIGEIPQPITRHGMVSST